MTKEELVNKHIVYWTDEDWIDFINERIGFSLHSFNNREQLKAHILICFKDYLDYFKEYIGEVTDDVVRFYKFIDMLVDYFFEKYKVIDHDSKISQYIDKLDTIYIKGMDKYIDIVNYCKQTLPECKDYVFEIANHFAFKYELDEIQITDVEINEY